MNHIIHSCTHAHVAHDRTEPISTTEMFAGMAAYLQQLLDLLEPRCIVVVVIVQAPSNTHLLAGACMSKPTQIRPACRWTLLS